MLLDFRLLVFSKDKADQAPDCTLDGGRGTAQLDLVKESDYEFGGCNCGLNFLGVKSLNYLDQNLEGGLFDKRVWVTHERHHACVFDLLQVVACLLLAKLYVVNDEFIEALLYRTKNAFVLRATLPQKLQQTLIGIKDFRRDKRCINDRWG